MTFDHEVRFTRDMVKKCWYLPGDFLDHDPWGQCLPHSLYNLNEFFGSSIPMTIELQPKGEITDVDDLNTILRATLHDWAHLGNNDTISSCKTLEEIHGEFNLTKFLVTPEYALYKLPSAPPLLKHTAYSKRHRDEVETRDYLFKTTDGKTFELLVQKQTFWKEHEDFSDYSDFEPYLKMWINDEQKLMVYLPVEESMCTKTTIEDDHDVFVMTPDVPCDPEIANLPYDKPVAYM